MADLLCWGEELGDAMAALIQAVQGQVKSGHGPEDEVVGVLIGQRH
jgi:hypothetical protein